MLSRALCLYARFSVPKELSPAKREAALRLKVLEWSPHAQPGVLIDWAEAEAGVWIWDQARIEEAMQSQGLDPKRVSVLAETALAEPLAEGTRIVACIEGIEGQAWREGQLVASRWWQEPPPPEEWRRFQRAAALPPEMQSGAAPVPESVAFLDLPWPKTRRRWLAMVNETGWARLAVAALVMLALPLVYEGTALVRIKFKTAQAEATLADLRQKADPVARAHLRAQAAMECVRALLLLDPYPDQLALLAKVGGQLQPNGTALGDWSFQNGELRFTVTHQQPLDSSQYVRLFEALNIFERVRAEPQGDGKVLVIQAKLRPQWS